MRKVQPLREVSDPAELRRRSKALQELASFLAQIGLTASFSAPRQKVFERIALAAENEGNCITAAVAYRCSVMDYGTAYLIDRAEVVLRQIDRLRRVCHAAQRPRVSLVYASALLDLATRTGDLAPGIRVAESWLASPMVGEVPVNIKHRFAMQLAIAYFFAGHYDRAAAIEAELTAAEAELDETSQSSFAGLRMELGTLSLIASHPYFAEAIFPLSPDAVCAQRAPEYLRRATAAIQAWPAVDPTHPDTFLRNGHLEDMALVQAAFGEAGSLKAPVPPRGDALRIFRLHKRACALLMNDQPENALAMMRLIQWNPVEQRGTFHVGLLFLLSRIYRHLGDDGMALAAHEDYVKAFSATLLKQRLPVDLPHEPCVAEVHGGADPDGRPGFLVDAIQLIRQAQGMDFTVAGLARDLGISERTLRSAFERFEGMGPRKYFETVRLDSLHAQLTHGCWTRGSLVDLATRYGFTSYSRFLKAYVERFGQRPGAVIRGGPRAVANELRA